MARTIKLRAVQDPEAGVYVVTGENYDGLTFEAESMEHALDRAKVIVPDLMEANGDDTADLTISLTEYRLAPHRELTVRVAA
ncbi:DUF1902 domain-containing protein [Azospirillum sp.]|uniref:DUF1902 domain-containing protein n=1 Tax=Azospirillum sp. TaxID=34012 RepID=UPI002D268C88|nr:DUF1902 domain-containing protein [Azospirillum sp.]HYD67929.1 DUF1902 domain-containing protein [Azospirillum sp.]